MKQITLRNRPNMTPMEEKPGKHAKMSKQSQIIVVRQQHRLFVKANLSHFKPFFVPKRGVSGHIWGHFMDGWPIIHDGKSVGKGRRGGRPRGDCAYARRGVNMLTIGLRANDTIMPMVPD